MGNLTESNSMGVILRLTALLVVALPVVYWLSVEGRRLASLKFSPQHGLIAGKGIFYLGIGLVFVSVLRELGFNLTHFLGAAGIVGIAVGFASQTSVSNVISGLFLIAEGPFVVGDVLTVGGVTGEVLSIDTLSVKLRTFDNKMVRIPNESMLKDQVMNVTRFPIRRIDLNVGVAYKEDLVRVREVLLDLAHKNPLILQDPEPLVILTGFHDSSLGILFAIWCARTDFLKARNSITEDIQRRFDEEGIEIPFPHMSLYAGSVTQPFPIVHAAESESK